MPIQAKTKDGVMVDVGSTVWYFSFENPFDYCYPRPVKWHPGSGYSTEAAARQAFFAKVRQEKNRVELQQTTIDCILAGE